MRLTGAAASCPLSQFFFSCCGNASDKVRSAISRATCVAFAFPLNTEESALTAQMVAQPLDIISEAASHIALSELLENAGSQSYFIHSINGRTHYGRCRCQPSRVSN